MQGTWSRAPHSSGQVGIAGQPARVADLNTLLFKVPIGPSECPSRHAEHRMRRGGGPPIRGAHPAQGGCHEKHRKNLVRGVHTEGRTITHQGRMQPSDDRCPKASSDSPRQAADAYTPDLLASRALLRCHYARTACLISSILSHQYFGRAYHLEAPCKQHLMKVPLYRHTSNSRQLVGLAHWHEWLYINLSAHQVVDITCLCEASPLPCASAAALPASHC